MQNSQRTPFGPEFGFALAIFGGDGGDLSLRDVTYRS